MKLILMVVFLSLISCTVEIDSHKNSVFCHYGTLYHSDDGMPVYTKDAKTGLYKTEKCEE